MANEKVCPQCGTRYAADHMFCFQDGAALIQAQTSTDLVGSIIADRYRVVSKIGDGGMGQVYLAEHVRMKRRCAVKIMRPQLMSDPVAVVRFNREAENASQISHPNVCAVYDFGETPAGLIYLAMEFIDGEPLSVILEQEGSLAPVRAADIISQTADALSAAHGLGILHRDLKPDNIMVGRSRAGTDHVKIVDFGIARVMSKESQQLTSTGIAVGTPEYMSPEQFAGDAVDARTDIYSLALVAYHTVTGTHAFGTGSTTDHLLARLTQPPRRLSDVKPEIDWPDSLQAVFQKALAADPSQRYADVLDFARDFTEGVAELPVTTTEEHYLSAIATRRLTPPRSFTPASGVPTIEGATTPRPAPSAGDAARDAGEWANADDTVAVREPSGERPAERLSTEEIVNAVRGGGTATRVAGPPDGSTGVPPIAGTEQAAGEGDESTIAMATAPAVERTPRSRRTGILVGGGLLVAAAAAAALILRPGTSAPRETAARPAAVTAPVRLDSAPPAAAAAAAPDSTLAAATRASGGRALDSAATGMRDGIVSIVSSLGRGTGFLADTARGAGLVVTSASLVPRDSIVDVQVDGATRLRARIAALDSKADVAVLAVALEPWSRRRVLPVGADSAVKAGDSLLALGSALAGPLTRRGVAKAEGDGRALPAFASRGEAGHVVISPAGVVAMATRRARASFAPASVLEPAVRAAKARVARAGFAAPSVATLPAWPIPAYPLDVVRAASRKDTFDVGPYRTAAQGYRVFAMTPPVLAWRDSTIARTRTYWASPFRLNEYRYDLVDPIQAWPAFRSTVAERRPVVVLSVVPAAVGEVRYRRFPDLSEPRSDRVDVRTARLLRDGQPVSALDSARFVGVVNPKDYEDRKRPVRTEQLLVFRLDDFTKPGTYAVEVTGTGGDKPVRVALPPALLSAVRGDAEQWRR